MAQTQERPSATFTSNIVNHRYGPTVRWKGVVNTLKEWKLLGEPYGETLAHLEWGSDTVYDVGCGDRFIDTAAVALRASGVKRYVGIDTEFGMGYTLDQSIEEAGKGGVDVLPGDPLHMLSCMPDASGSVFLDRLSNRDIGFDSDYGLHLADEIGRVVPVGGVVCGLLHEPYIQQRMSGGMVFGSKRQLPQGVIDNFFDNPAFAYEVPDRCLGSLHRFFRKLG